MSASGLNLDPAELAKFDAMATRWWDPEGEMRPLHLINPLRAHYVQTTTTIEGARCLDVGCGAGLLAEELAKAGGYVTGIDASAAALQVGRLHAKLSQLDIDYTLTTAEELAASRGEANGENPRFDVVTCMELVEHVPAPASLVKACANLTRPGGSLIFSTINRTARAYLLAVVAAEHLLRMLPTGTHDYAKFVRPSELASMGRAAGLELQDVQGVVFNPLIGGFRLARDASVNYLIRFRRPA